MKIRRKEIGCGRMFPGVVAVDLKISCPWFLELWRKQFQGFWNYKVKIIMELLGVSVLKTLFYTITCQLWRPFIYCNIMKVKFQMIPTGPVKMIIWGLYLIICILWSEHSTLVPLLRQHLYYYDIAVPVFVYNGKNAFSDKSPSAYCFRH